MDDPTYISDLGLLQLYGALQVCFLPSQPKHPVKPIPFFPLRPHRFIFIQQLFTKPECRRVS